MLPSIRVFVVESAAAPDAKLFAVRHAQGYLCRDNGGNVVLGTDRADVDRQRRQLNLASVAHVVALVPESEVGVEATSPPLARLMQAAGELGMVLVQEGGDLRLRRLSLDAVPALAEAAALVKPEGSVAEALQQESAAQSAPQDPPAEPKRKKK